jgi:hypothetical protein
MVCSSNAHTINEAVMSSAAKAELEVLNLNVKEAVFLRQNLTQKTIFLNPTLWIDGGGRSVEQAGYTFLVQ